jgi:predicted phosphodiesterase
MREWLMPDRRRQEADGLVSVRMAVISDVHGNLPALEAVLADIARRGADLVVNLGDLLSGAVLPRETADRLMGQDMVTVRGNHDRQLLTVPPGRMGSADRLAAEAIGPEHRGWLAGLRPVAAPVPGVLAFHGRPADDQGYLLETVTAAGTRPATAAEVTVRLGARRGPTLYLCGHSHVQRTMRLASGELVVNPGSVGLQAYHDDEPTPHDIEAGTPHARYSTVDGADGRWQVSEHSVEYDWGAAAAVAEANGRPDAAVALRSGRVAARGQA